MYERTGCSLNAGPLDWTPSDTETTNLNQPKPEVSRTTRTMIPRIRRDSYFEMDVSLWDGHQGERDKVLTVPTEQEEELDTIIPLIVEVA